MDPLVILTIFKDFLICCSCFLSMKYIHPIGQNLQKIKHPKRLFTRTFGEF
ncbi:hypothetical protein JCM19039_4351 [Geomicrobium sp. JCM 19039]|nr:hypothetical protein JCM19039_4351 [Geomicrobium sp. JCM 19039]